MANAGGGLIVYGIDEEQKAATERLDVGELSEQHERALRSVAVTAISPPVFGLEVHRLGEDGSRVVAVVVPDSQDGPHLIYRGEYFGAPIRNDADTVWMRERQIERMYRARFEERRYAHEALDALYAEAATGCDSGARAWFVGVARPRTPVIRLERLEHDIAREIMEHAQRLASVYTGPGGIHPFGGMQTFGPRPGLRRWVFDSSSGERTAWREARGSIHDDGAVTVASAIGGHRTHGGEYHPGSTVEATAIECAIADLSALIRAAAERRGANEYEVRIGIEWSGDDPMTFLGNSGWNSYAAATVPAYRALEAVLAATDDPVAHHRATYELATDAINQAGVRRPQMMTQPPTPT